MEKLLCPYDQLGAQGMSGVSTPKVCVPIREMIPPSLFRFPVMPTALDRVADPGEVSGEGAGELHVHTGGRVLAGVSRR
jgi:hypothetical protein